jgi:ABC-type multidrug transport system permease subunit
MTDTCGKATIVSLYQVSDAVYDLTDKVLLIDEGRMIYQGPSKLAKGYFEALGYEAQPRQTIADFLASVTSVSERRFRPGWEMRTPKGAEALEQAFRASSHYQMLQNGIRDYEAGLVGPHTKSQASSMVEHAENFKQTIKASKSRYVPKKSSYTISFPKQVYICTKRQLWQLKGNSAAFFIKVGSTVINALLIGSMFYDQPATSEGAFSRGGFMFYSAILLGWIQLAELEEAVQGRNIISRQKRFAFVSPSAVSFARVFVDLIIVLIQTLVYSIIAYFLAGMQQSVS